MGKFNAARDIDRKRETERIKNKTFRFVIVNILRAATVGVAVSVVRPLTFLQTTTRIHSFQITYTHTQSIFSGGQQRPRSANKPTTNRILNRNKTKKVVKCVNSMKRMLPSTAERSIRYTESKILPVPQFIERFVGRLRFLFAVPRVMCFFLYVHSTLHFNFNWSPSKS